MSMAFEHMPNMSLLPQASNNITLSLIHNVYPVCGLGEGGVRVGRGEGAGRAGEGSSTVMHVLPSRPHGINRLQKGVKGLQAC